MKPGRAGASTSMCTAWMQLLPVLERHPTALPGAVTPTAPLARRLAGSDEHLFLAMDTLLRAAESHARDDPRVGEATKVCLRAHLLRYGRVSDAVLQQLIRARSQTPYYLDR